MASRASLPLPLIIELRQFAEYLRGGPGASLVRFITDGGSGACPMDGPALTARLALPDPHVLLLLDGLDEVFEEGPREAVLRAVRALPQSIRVVVTSRIVGYLPSWLQAWDYAHFRIQLLSEEQTRVFVLRWHETTYDPDVEVEVRDVRAARLLAALQDIPQLRELSRNPLLLTMIALLNRRPEDLPSRRVQVLEECARLLVHRWKVADAEAKARVSLVNLRPFVFDRKVALLTDLAWAMQGGGEKEAPVDGSALRDDAPVGNLVQHSTLLHVCKVHAARVLGPAAAPFAAFEIVERLHDHHGVLSFLGGSSYAFAHLAFLEYFCARRVFTFVEDDEWDNTALQHWFARRALQPAWDDVLTLVCGIVSSAVVGPCLSALVDAGHVMLAARCVEQLRDRAKAEPHVDKVRKELLFRALRCARDDTNGMLLEECSVAASTWHDDATRNAMLEAARSEARTDDRAVWTLLKFWPRDADVVSHAERISKLMLQSFGFSEGDKATLRTVILSVPHLQQLNLEANSLGEAGISVLAQAMHAVPRLQQLNLEGNNIGEAGARALADALHSVSQLQELSLNLNGIGDAGACALAEPLRCVQQLQQLLLQSNCISEDGACALAEALENFPELRRLDLKNNRIGNVGAGALAAVLRFVPKLQELNLDGNDIGEAGARDLARALHSVPWLQELNLDLNGIGDNGARALAEALRSDSVPHWQLQQLHLKFNSIGDAGAGALALALNHVPLLQQLYLGANSIGDSGARDLAEALRFVPQLQLLSLWGNSIGEAGARALAKAMRSVPQLQQLDLGDNSIGEAYSRDIAQSLRSMLQLQQLHVRDIRISDAIDDETVYAAAATPEISDVDATTSHEMGVASIVSREETRRENETAAVNANVTEAVLLPDDASAQRGGIAFTPARALSVRLL